MERKRVIRKKRKGLRMGCFLWLVLLAIAAAVAVVLILRPSADGSNPASKRSDALWDGSWYEDDLNCIRKDRPLIKGMEAFEEKTGARPYLVLLSGVDPTELDTFAREQYEALFSGGDHLLVVYDEWGADAYYLSARTGNASALSAADISLLLSCIEKAYADPDNGSYAEAFGAGFTEGARQISVEGQGGGRPGLLLGIALLLLTMGLVLILFLRKNARDTGR